MPKFCIPLEREVLQYNYLVIEANDPDEARAKYNRGDYKVPDDFFERWEETKYCSDDRLAQHRNWNIRRAKDCQHDGYHDHFGDDLSEDYLVSFDIPGWSTRLHMKIHANDEYDAEAKLLDAKPHAKDIYVEDFEPKHERLFTEGGGDL